ncbi:MAG TPA: tRNA pseudouridine(38-40) synthase TruA [Clostridiales bacterium]|nr:tRNA pseudouridine(38-40) synthase TruA [Clostridiales bacterium]
MRNILLKIAYSGVNYHGWQIQDNAGTVQARIQSAAYDIFGYCPDIKACSRTDTGVHANEFALNFKTDSNISIEKIPDAFNHFLPNDIRVFSAETVNIDFHARYDCLGKEYKYIFLNSKYDDPFRVGLVTKYPYPIDVEKLNLASKHFIGTHDFSSFCASGSSVENHIRTIFNSKVERNENDVIFIISGNGFLYNMVRIMAGTLLAVNENKIQADEIPDIILSKNRNKAGITAPPHGLYLNKVFYNEEEIV